MIDLERFIINFSSYVSFFSSLAFSCLQTSRGMDFTAYLFHIFTVDYGLKTHYNKQHLLFFLSSTFKA